MQALVLLHSLYKAIPLQVVHNQIFLIILELVKMVSQSESEKQGENKDEREQICTHQALLALAAAPVSAEKVLEQKLLAVREGQLQQSRQAVPLPAFCSVQENKSKVGEH